MRYKLTKRLKNIIKCNYKALFNSKLKNNLKNFLYKNKTIDIKHIKGISRILNLDLKKLRLKKVNFNYKKNLGRHSETVPITFAGCSKEFAEFVGIMLGDGNIYKNMIRIVINKKEDIFKKYIINLFYNIFGINLNFYEKGNRTIFSKNNKKLAALLLNYGLKRGDKIKNRVTIPKWILTKREYMARCLRGLIDTDGSFYYSKRDKRFYIQFKSYSLRLLSDFKLISAKLGFEFAKAGRNAVCLYRKKEIEKYIKDIGFSNSKHGAMV